MIILESQYDEASPRIRFEIHSDTSRDELIATLDAFIKAIGYCYDGELAIDRDINHEEA